MAAPRQADAPDDSTLRERLANDARAREFLTPEALSEMLGVPKATVYKWNHSGTGPRFIRVGKHVRYRRADVDAWVELKASGPAA